MPAVSYIDFSGGLDRRLSVNSQDANKLWVLRNAYVTLGKRLKKRPGLAVVATGLTGSYGLKSANSALNVFCDTGAVFVPPVVGGLPINRVNLDIPVSGGGSGSTINSIYYADLFQNYLYVVARYATGATKHHYVDSKSSTVTITNAAPGVVTWTAHGLAANQEVKFSTTGTLPNPLVAGTTYYVRNPAANTFEVSATSGGASINTTTAGAGVHTASIPTYIIDAGCPHTAAVVTKAASRIFAPNGENVAYCAAGAARDWSTASNAGFLAAGLQQDTKGATVAVGTFQESLVVLFQDSSQIWNVAVDPAANVISKRLYGVGTREPLSLSSFFNDLVFLSPYGFRSMTVQALTARIDDNDVGVPVDSLVQADINTRAGLVNGDLVSSIWIPQLGQYWSIFDMGTYSKVWAYTFSRSSKIANWSEYILPVKITSATTYNGKVYLRDTDNLYEVSATQYTDNGTAIAVSVEMAFQDAKLPGVAKQVWGADMVTEGSWSLSFKYDPRDTTKETVPLTISGDTRPGDVIPVDVVAPAIAPVFSHSASEAASIDALTLMYHTLGVI